MAKTHGQLARIRRRRRLTTEPLALVTAAVALTLIGCQQKGSSPSPATTAQWGDEGGGAPPPPRSADDDRPAEAAAPSAGDDERMATPPAWATWPMPNAPASGLPNPQDYDTSVAGVTTDRVTGLVWQRYPNKESATFSEAKRACARLTLAGYDDWRLPSRIELVSIVDLTRSEPSIHPVAFPRTPSDWFWTGSIAADRATEAWYVYFYFGYPKTDDVTNRFAVRCVRTPPAPTDVAPPAARYAVQTETVRDVATGLTWERVVPQTKLPFEAARSYCERLSLGGRRGWRLPSMPELLTLVDERTTAPPTIDGTAFPRTPPDSFWTASAFAETAAQAWHVYFDRGNALYGLLNAAYHVRCVR